MKVSVQQEDFDLGAEVRAFANPRVGAIASFVGVVRDVAMTLVHYPGMTQKALEAIAAEAASRWPLAGVTLIHRYGPLHPGDRIVFVGTASSHRAAALESCAFLIDWLKTKAPFWKQERFADGAARWVEAKAEDDAATARWD